MIAGLAPERQGVAVEPSSPGHPTARWQQALRGAIRDADELRRLLDLPPEFAAAARRAAVGFPLLVTQSYLARIRRGDVNDPLLRQILPLDAELESAPNGYLDDPVDDAGAEVVPGLLRKYAGRALLITTGACAIHCRYCFRRHFPYHEVAQSRDHWSPALEAIAADPSLDEVILSGGDPLTLVDVTLADLADRLAEIPHVRRLRVHTRLPIVLPQRVDDALLAWLTGTRLTPLVVVHANHPSEIDDEVASALARLVDAGIPVLNQAVLLRGVNDSVDTLEALCRRLVDLRVFPYYLHQLDPVRGAAHFEVPIEVGQRLIARLNERLPGYAVPRYVRETPGAAHKLPL